MTLVMNLDNKKILMNFKCLFYKNMRINMYFVCVGCILEVVVSVFSNCISSKNNFFEDQNHRAPVISFLKIEAPIQKIPYRPRFFLLPVTLLFIRNRNSHSMDYYRLKKKSPEILLLEGILIDDLPSSKPISGSSLFQYRQNTNLKSRF